MKKMAILCLSMIFAFVIFPGLAMASRDGSKEGGYGRSERGKTQNTRANINSNSLQEKKLYTRSNLRADGSTIFFHNMSLSRGDIIPVGTEVTIVEEGRKCLKFRVTDTGKKYTLEALPKDYERYFVEDVNEIGLDKINSNFKGDVKNMLVKEGMSKEEVYISKGCPSFIGPGQKSWFYTLPQVMQSDSWWYNYNSRGKEMNVSFKDGVAVKVNRY